MRHANKVNSLGRKSAHRKAMLSNMAASLILHKRIKTTVAKAKVLRRYVEPLITRSKLDNTHNRRMVFRHLQNKNAVSELFREVATKIAERPGGYTRIIKLDSRLGDNSDMCFIELVDYNELMLMEKEEAAKAKKTRRGGRRRSSKPKDEQKADKITDKTESNNETVERKVENKEKDITETPKDDKPSKPTTKETESPESKEETGKVEEDTPVGEEKKETPKAKKEEPVAKKEEKAEEKTKDPEQKDDDKNSEKK